jgi:hypothetical protein
VPVPAAGVLSVDECRHCGKRVWPGARVFGADSAERELYPWVDEAGNPTCITLAHEPGTATVTEYGTISKSGDRMVWDTAPYIEKVYPLTQRIEDTLLNGGEVYQRRVIVVEDWAEVDAP